MDRAQIQAELTKVFHDVFEDDEIELSDDFSAECYEPWDSLNHIILILQIEKHFNAKFSHAELAGMENVGDLINLIARKSG